MEVCRWKNTYNHNFTILAYSNDNKFTTKKNNVSRVRYARERFASPRFPENGNGDVPSPVRNGIYKRLNWKSINNSLGKLTDYREIRVRGLPPFRDHIIRSRIQSSYPPLQSVTGSIKTLLPSYAFFIEISSVIGNRLTQRDSLSFRGWRTKNVEN